MEKEASKAVNNAEKSFERTLAKDQNKRGFSSYVRSKTKSRSSVGPLKVGNRTTSDTKKWPRH